ncbi:MAG: hypothetical protein M5U26_22490 [Planctomycetota bacterium]|nr:hypothetical protein [Planctomycetota bacterium]
MLNNASSVRLVMQGRIMLQAEGQDLVSDFHLEDEIEGLRQQYIDGEFEEPVLPLLVLGTAACWLCYLNLSRKKHELQCGTLFVCKHKLPPGYLGGFQEGLEPQNFYTLNQTGTRVEHLAPFQKAHDTSHCFVISKALDIARLRKCLDFVDVRFTLDGKERVVLAARIVLEPDTTA